MTMYGHWLGTDSVRQHIDLNRITKPHRAHPGAYSQSSAAQGLTRCERSWFSAAMTQRSIQQPQNTPAHRAARSAVIAQPKRIEIPVLNVALAALVVVVVVLITPFTGAG